MDAEELDRRARTYDGWLRPEIVTVLLDAGYLDELHRQAEAGDWYCARRLARIHAEQGRLDEALELLDEYVRVGWWTAVDVAAAILDESGRGGEATALVRPFAEAGNRVALHRLIGLLSRQGRLDEAFVVARTHSDDWFLISALVDVGGDAGRADELVAILRARIGPDPWQADVLMVGQLARILERQGFADDAVELLRFYANPAGMVQVNHVEQLADLLVRHGRLDQLQEVIARPGGEHAAERLAEFLAERGQIEDALDTLRPFIATGDPNRAWQAAEILERAGRVDEAIDVLRPFPTSMTGDTDWMINRLAELLVTQGRPEEALSIIDSLAAPEQGPWFEVARIRFWILAHSGRVDQAIAELRVHHEADTWYGEQELATLLADSGRLEDAVALLQASSHARHHGILLQKLLIRQGRVAEAIAAAR
ncbi:MAG: tetratricopeptide repeat protein, partial [Catenulispora sp.]|nr:tetratricopeptide repeat protein [Catenulispora sp.]